MDLVPLYGLSFLGSLDFSREWQLPTKRKLAKRDSIMWIIVSHLAVPFWSDKSEAPTHVQGMSLQTSAFWGKAARISGMQKPVLWKTELQFLKHLPQALSSIYLCLHRKLLELQALLKDVGISKSFV